MARVVVVSGFKKSGKTTIIEDLIKELKDRGHRVATVKHVQIENFSFDESGTDTWRLADAGSDRVVAFDPEGSKVLDSIEDDLQSILLGMNEFDFVILEGFKNLENFARIIVPREESEIQELEDEFTIGIVGGTPSCDFGFEEIEDIADLIENRAVTITGGLDCGHCGFETCREYVISAVEGEAPVDGCVALGGNVSLLVDGERIPLKPFVQDLIGNAITGIVSALKRSDGRRIEINVEKDEG